MKIIMPTNFTPSHPPMAQLVLSRRGRAGIVTDRSPWRRRKCGAEAREPQENSRTAPFKTKGCGTQNRSRRSCLRHPPKRGP